MTERMDNGPGGAPPIARDGGGGAEDAALDSHFTLRAINDIGEVPAAAWDACANPPGLPANPFLSHAFLHALETSGSVCARTGWLPYHALIEDLAGSVAAVAPLYIKAHSRGEYVFDYGWAEAFEQAGGRYYPKLLGAVPFTPVTGRRLLLHPEFARRDPRLLEQLAAGCVELARRLEVSSLHLNFVEEEQSERLTAIGFLARTDQQFHWHNEGYATFDDFVAHLSSKRRKNLRRERRIAVENDIEIEWVTGAALQERHWDAFHAFYQDTGSRKWGRPYLNRAFFHQVGETMPDEILLVMCRRAGHYVAGALNFIGGDTLYGRYWGCLEHHPMLHFEVCYHQAIDFAIAHGLEYVEAGAQGGHKIARGYLPRRTHSVHWIAHEGLHHAIERYLEHERQDVEDAMEVVARHSPFRSGDGAAGG